MADIARSEPYRALFRSIGYSVGGEKLLARTVDLVSFYFENRGLTRTDWRKIVSDVYGRKVADNALSSLGGLQKKDAADHMADMYSSLGLLQQIDVELFPGTALEALSALRRVLSISDSSDVRKIARVVLLSEILSSDGDIFLNCLAAEFNQKRVKANLEAVVEQKRERIARIIRSPDILRKIYHFISIKSFVPKKSGQSDSPFAMRTTPLSTGRRSPLDQTADTKINIADDYLRKAPQLRKGWSEDLNLFDDKQLTASGRRLLDRAEAIGLKGTNENFCVWPYSQELLQLRMSPLELEVPEIRPWDIAKLSSDAYIDQDSRSKELTNDQLFQVLGDILRAYRESSEARGKIRHQLPLSIANLCIVGYCVFSQTMVPNLNEFLEEEGKRDDRRINVANLRGAEGALDIKSSSK